MPTKTHPSTRKPRRAATPLERDGWHPQSALANRALPVLGNKCAPPPENRAAIADVLGASRANRSANTAARTTAPRHPKTAR